MEIFLNCIWLLLGLTLISVWTVYASHTRQRRPDLVIPSRRVQFTALLLLVILLFPVISLTDDLAMCTAPRDAERALRLHDLFNGTQPSPALLPSTMAWMDAVRAMLRERSHRPDEGEVGLAALQESLPRSVDSRPPPISASL